MTDKAAKPQEPAKQPRKSNKLQQQIDDLTLDLQRTRADFENYRKRNETDKAATYQHGQAAAIMQLLPVIDNIERAVRYMPVEMEENKWAQGVASLVKNLEKSLNNLNLNRIDAAPGTAFNPDLHEAIQFDEDAEGDYEVIAEEMQAGYTLAGEPIRHAMVKVTKQ